MGWASRINPKSHENKPLAQIALTASREYSPGDLQHGDVVTIGTSLTRWRVDEKSEPGVIILKPIGIY